MTGLILKGVADSRLDSIDRLSMQTVDPATDFFFSLH